MNKTFFFIRSAHYLPNMEIITAFIEMEQTTLKLVVQE